MIVKYKHFYTKFEDFTENELNEFMKNFELDNKILENNEQNKLLWIKIFKEGLITFLFVKSNKMFEIVDVIENINNSFKINFYRKVIKNKYSRLQKKNL